MDGVQFQVLIALEQQ